MKTFKDKVAVITGGGGTGIGNALVRAFAKEGAHVAFCDISGLEKTQQDINGFNIRSYCEHADISKKEDIERFAGNVIKGFGQVDILVNNAGIASGDVCYEALTEEDFESITDVNYWGVIRTTRAFYPHLIKRPEAAIANISSSQGILAAPFLVSYCTTKFAVRGFTDALRAEHDIRGINNLTIHTVHPGGVATDITLHAKYQGSRSKKFHDILQKDGATPQSAAETILKGIRNKKGRIFISDGRLQDIITRLFPTSYPFFLKLFMKWKKIDTV